MATAPAVPLHSITQPLTEQNLIDQAAHLVDLQGNIFKHHGRDHAAHVFLKFKAGKAVAAKKWLGTDLKARLTTAKKQIDDAAEHRRSKKNGGPFWALLLSGRQPCRQ